MTKYIFIDFDKFVRKKKRICNWCCRIANWRGSDRQGDSVAALESRSGAEDQRQGVELWGDRIRQQRSQSSACRTHRSLVILELDASDDGRNELILCGYSGDSWFYDEPMATQPFKCSALSAPSTTSTITSHSLSFNRLVRGLIGLCFFQFVAVPVRTTSDQPYRLQKFKLRLFIS